MSLKDTDDLSWYARRAARSSVRPGAEPEPAHIEKIATLLEDLRTSGIRGDVGSMTLFTHRLPPGCKPCLSGKGTNLYVTGLCTRDCFFCFNQKPRKDETVVHGIPVREPEEAAAIVTRFGLNSVGLSGGEPLMFPKRVLRLLQVLKAMKPAPLVDLYTNGDRVDETVLRQLRDAGLDGIRFDAAARDYDLTPVALAHKLFDEVAVEVPVIPNDMPQLKAMILKLDRMEVPFLNIHELFLCSENQDRMVTSGEKPLEGKQPSHLSWRPTAHSLECCLEILLFATRNCRALSVYLCSCGTQEMISRRGLKRRRQFDLTAAP